MVTQQAQVAVVCLQHRREDAEILDVDDGVAVCSRFQETQQRSSLALMQLPSRKWLFGPQGGPSSRLTPLPVREQAQGFERRYQPSLASTSAGRSVSPPAARWQWWRPRHCRRRKPCRSPPGGSGAPGHRSRPWTPHPKPNLYPCAHRALVLRLFWRPHQSNLYTTSAATSRPTGLATQ